MATWEGERDMDVMYVGTRHTSSGQRQICLINGIRVVFAVDDGDNVSLLPSRSMVPIVHSSAQKLSSLKSHATR